MKKYILIISALVITAALAAAAVPVFAGKYEPAGKSDVAHLYLYQKNPADWSIVQGGAWGKLKYNLEGREFDFVFNGHQLVSGENYSLIYYADPWPGNHPGAFIANGVANEDGDLHLDGSVNLGMDLPDSADANFPSGAKIWLVKSSDYNSSTNSMTGWHPTQYLFEHNLITYTDTDN